MFEVENWNAGILFKLEASLCPLHSVAVLTVTPVWGLAFLFLVAGSSQMMQKVNAIFP